MNRVVPLLFGIVAGCVTPDSGGVCGTSAPALPTCVAHGLANIDLNGEWTFTGTDASRSYLDQSPDPPPQPVVTQVVFTVAFEADGCTFRWINGQILSGQNRLDDTNATDVQFVYRNGLIGPATICGNADGTLSLHWALHSVNDSPGGPLDSEQEDSGTLSR